MPGGPALGQTGRMRTAIVVPGHEARGPDGVYRISPSCVRLVREAERLAAELAAETVVFTGWSRGPGESEAEQMRAAWSGPAIDLVVESTASVTAENAARTVPLLVERGIERAVVICSRLHVYRARFFFQRLYGARGIDTEFRVVPVRRGLRDLAWEVGAATAIRRQLRAVRNELARHRHV